MCVKMSFDEIRSIFPARGLIGNVETVANKRQFKLSVERCVLGDWFCCLVRAVLFQGVFP